MRFVLFLALLTLTACAHDQQGVEVRTVTVEKPVMQPCPATPPVRPAPLAKPLPTDLSALVATLAAKLGEYVLPGKYADQAEAYVRACPPSAPAH
jgi:hypothetical protein